MIKILNPGVYASVQDTGRIGYAAFGVPISGAMDVFSHQLANKILNNTDHEATIEVTYGNFKMQFLSPTEFCVTGAVAQLFLNDKSIGLHKRYLVQKDDVLLIKNPTLGVRNYIGVKGGIQSKVFLESRSFFKEITPKQRLQKADLLPIKIDQQLHAKHSYTALKIMDTYLTSAILPCYKGPEFNFLSKEDQQKLCSNSFHISKENNRMGYRLVEQLASNSKQILTAAVLPGTVQYTPSGALIILMKDCQVTGGYPRILQLTEQAIQVLAQKSTLQTIQFKLIII